jgi:shikimate dehydrogenase
MRDVYNIADLRRWNEATADCVPPLRLAVIGDPVAHSKSPQMHNAALEALGIPTRYTRLHIRPDELRDCLSLLGPAGFIGINCTIPHKGAVLDAVDKIDVIAKRAQGVNTVTLRPDGSLVGTSTDGPGFARAISEAFGKPLSSLAVMILGAGGGAGRAISMQCASAGCLNLMLVNRTLEKLEPLLDDLAEFYPSSQVAAGDFGDVFLHAGLGMSDLVVNCTSIGMNPNDPSPIPAKLIDSRHLLYDTIYVAHRTPLLRAGDEAGARGENGLSMLLHQGALSFERWFHQTAPLEVMREALVNASGKKLEDGGPALAV